MSIILDKSSVQRVNDKMAYVRVQKRGKRKYYYLVKSERKGDKVKQKVMQYLGTRKPSKSETASIIKEILGKNEVKGI